MQTVLNANPTLAVAKAHAEDPSLPDDQHAFPWQFLGLIGLADPLLVVPSTNSARIQEMHIFLGQCMCGAVERAMGLV